MTTLKKLFVILTAVCLLTALAGCPTPLDPQTPPAQTDTSNTGNTDTTPADTSANPDATNPDNSNPNGTPDGSNPDATNPDNSNPNGTPDGSNPDGTPDNPGTAPTVVATYTITNMDESVITVIFYSDNTYTESEEGRISTKGTYAGTLAEGETITLTPTEFNFGEEEDNFMTEEAATAAFAEDAMGALIIAGAFTEQDYKITGTTLINVTGDDDPDPEDPPVIPPAAPTVVATFKETSTPYNTTFVFYSNNTYILKQKGYPAEGGTYAGSISAGESITMTKTSVPIYAYYADEEAAPEDIDFTLLTIDEAVTAILDESNTTAAPIHESIASKYSENGGCTETNIRSELERFYQSSLGTISISDDGTSFTAGELTFNKEED